MESTAVLSSVSEDLIVDLAQGLLRHQSVRGNEGPIGEYLASRMRELGYEVLVQEVVHDRPNVIGIVRGRGTLPGVMLNGHLDVGEPVGGWTRDPFVPAVEDGYLYGHGVTDMKGAIASMVAAGAAIIRSGAALDGDLVVAAVMHHDTIGLGTKYLLQALDVPCRHGICGEPTGLALQLANSGACQFEIEVTGKPMHVSRREEGVNAIVKALPIVQDLTDAVFTHTPDPRLPFLPRVVVGQVVGGTAPGSTAARCVIRGDVRTDGSMTPTTVRRDLEHLIQRLARRDPDLVARVRVLATQHPYLGDPDAQVAQVVRGAHVDVTGQAPRVTTGLPAGSFVTDAADMVRAGVPTVVYGPCEWKTVADERTPVAELVTAARVYALSAARLCGVRV